MTPYNAEIFSEKPWAKYYQWSKINAPAISVTFVKQAGGGGGTNLRPHVFIIPYNPKDLLELTVGDSV